MQASGDKSYDVSRKALVSLEARAVTPWASGRWAGLLRTGE